MEEDRVKKLCVFTTHTPVESGHDKFPYQMVGEMLGEFVPYEALKRLAGQDRMNMTRLALNLSKYVNGVAEEHRETSREMFPGYKIHAITNGIHSHTWTSNSFKEIYDEYLPGWAIEPHRLARVEVIPDEEIWKAHRMAKKSLMDYINERTGRALDEDALTIGFGRRATGYKRADLIFSDLDKLKKITIKGDIQLVFGGKAHPKDDS
ncbi:alpha-glucan family phosphorylase, partial [Candidatus Bathyarchaeota archaeon]|nr:alpha-glucan family phosphorylase [Candidatus Bathyarchaeota archaeon]NIR16483.1 alpha-glucan family phosphorylase [Desulfobacterales bacterium]NIU81216.1 alpha-glucan family phosphorylase [Candidatus Bathyarchaeota archaeon]NIV67858.1 alpha-glucan family phosphorylase [Candidatus Bathyarchaeota archaeon]NIW34461.1 alpha-glucan family phosphorylase [Candidatus Bathyarchaeota archaeon]